MKQRRTRHLFSEGCPRFEDAAQWVNRMRRALLPLGAALSIAMALGCGGKTSDSSNPPDTGSDGPGSVTALPRGAWISANLAHTCARRNDGIVKCWGDNVYGQAGDSGTDASQKAPTS